MPQFGTENLHSEKTGVFHVRLLMAPLQIYQENFRNVGLPVIWVPTTRQQLSMMLPKPRQAGIGSLTASRGINTMEQQERPILPGQIPSMKLQIGVLTMILVLLNLAVAGGSLPTPNGTTWL